LRITVQAHRGEVARHNRDVEQMQTGLRDRSPTAVQGYLELVLARTPLPGDFPRTIEVAYTSRGEQAVVRFELPPVEVVPTDVSYAARSARRSPTRHRPRTGPVCTTG
jgi:restriction system protein